jgi:hypothetical protein
VVGHLAHLGIVDGGHERTERLRLIVGSFQVATPDVENEDPPHDKPTIAATCAAIVATASSMVEALIERDVYVLLLSLGGGRYLDGLAVESAFQDNLVADQGLHLLGSVQLEDFLVAVLNEHHRLSPFHALNRATLVGSFGSIGCALGIGEPTSPFPFFSGNQARSASQENDQCKWGDPLHVVSFDCR